MYRYILGCTLAWICRVSEGRINANNVPTVDPNSPPDAPTFHTPVWVSDASHPFHKSGGWGYRFTVGLEYKLHSVSP